jgi:subtilase family serine protease
MRYRLLFLILLIMGIFFFPWSSSFVLGATGPVPNRLIVVRAPASGAQQATQTIQNVATIKQIYTQILVLPHEALHNICPSYISAVYHLNFFLDKKKMQSVTILQGGCTLIIINQKDIRIPNAKILKLLHDTKILDTYVKVQGLTPLDLQDAYNLTSSSASGIGATIGIIDAYNDPHAESDMAVYRKAFSLPSCTTINGCFRKINQAGGTWMPRADTGWSTEIALDLDMVSAICPLCHIVLVEASSPSFHDLGNAVITAVKSGASIVSNSYGTPEDASTGQYAFFYNHPGTIILASAGDSGYSVQIPASYPGVIAVGGTTLNRDSSNRGWVETAWGGTGSGCSEYQRKPSWQKDTGCPTRTVVDVAAVADPQTGVAVYNTFGAKGWGMFGGTSASTPIIAGVYGLAGNAKTVTAASLYSSPTGSFYDVIGGNNGDCTPLYLCTALPGYDGPTGLGSPNGLGGF